MKGEPRVFELEKAVEAVPAEPKSALKLARTIAAWILSVLLALLYLRVSSMKLMSAPPAVQEFDHVGLGQWFRYFTGLLEISGAIGLLIPRLRYWPALLLAMVMVGAIVAHLTRLHSPPTLPAVLLLALFATAWLRK